jgi:mRNA (guanine-N7-)-methyltransferase
MEYTSTLINCILETGTIQNFILEKKYDLNINRLRTFHNLIKKQLYEQTNILINYSKTKSLLDLACGKGGDIQKWLLLNNIKYILAVDYNIESIKATRNKNGYDGAIARWNNIKKTKTNTPYIRFEILNLLNPISLSIINNIDNNKKYEIISCQFALHYFAENYETLFNIFKLISSKLKKGGIFIGTATNGDLIYNILNNGNVKIPLLTLEKLNLNNYLFNITEETYDETRKSYFKLEGESSEYYLFIYNIKKIIKNPEINMDIIEIKSFYEWYNNPYIINKLKQYSNYPLSPYEMIISFLNFSFIFKKN